MYQIKPNMITGLNVEDGFVFYNQNTGRCLERDCCFAMRQLGVTPQQRKRLDSQSYSNSLIGDAIYG